MKLLKLQLENFRNYKKFEMDFEKDGDIILISGENGKGKTNILEGIYMLSTGKTFRDVDNDDLLQWGMDFFILSASVAHSDKVGARAHAARATETLTLQVAYSNYPRKQKNFKINDVKTPHIEYLGNFITVLFHPKDLNMLYLEPQLRRKYLNLLLSQTDKFYIEALGNYTKILKQRNALLEEISEEKSREDELETWDEKLAETGAVLILERKKLIKFFNGKIGGFYRKISGGKENVEIKYIGTVLDSPNDSCVSDGSESADSYGRSPAMAVSHDSKSAVIDNHSSDSPNSAKSAPTPDLHSIKKQYLKKLILKRDRDLRYGTTGAGPHLEDIKFYLNGKEISTFASRGEFRTILIALKMAEIEYIEDKTKEKPVLLLDDVFSELDENRQSHLFDAIKSCQAIITAAGIANQHLSEKISRVVEL